MKFKALIASGLSIVAVLAVAAQTPQASALPGAFEDFDPMEAPFDPFSNPPVLLGKPFTFNKCTILPPGSSRQFHLWASTEGIAFRKVATARNLGKTSVCRRDPSGNVYQVRVTWTVRESDFPDYSINTDFFDAPRYIERFQLNLAFGVLPTKARPFAVYAYSSAALEGWYMCLLRYIDDANARRLRC